MAANPSKIDRDVYFGEVRGLLSPDGAGFDLINERTRNSECFDDLSYRSAIPSYQQGFFHCQFRSALMAVLFSSGSPAAVVRIVVPIIVDAVDCKTGRAFSHIGEEVFKNVPQRPNIDPAPAPILKLLVAWVVAAFHHAGPRRVSFRPWAFTGSSGHQPAMAVGGVVNRAGLSSETPTRFGKTARNIGFVNNRRTTAVANAAPTKFVDRFNCNQSSETLTCDIGNSGHGRSSLQVARSSDLLALTRRSVAHFSRRLACV